MELDSLPRITITEIVKCLNNSSSHVDQQMQNMKSKNNVCKLSNTQVALDHTIKILNRNGTKLFWDLKLGGSCKYSLREI